MVGDRSAGAGRTCGRGRGTHLLNRPRLIHVLLIRVDEQNTLLELLLAHELRELLPRLLQPLRVCRVDYEDERLGVLVVVSPQMPNRVLTAHIPDHELNVLEGDRLNIKAEGGLRFGLLSKLELIEDGRLARRIKAKHQYSALLPA